MSRLSTLIRVVLVLGLLGGLLGAGAIAGVYWYLEPKLPSTDLLREVRLQTPLRVYSRSGKVVAEFGEKRRTPVTIAEVPAVVTEAFLAAEDERFYQHPGVDWQGLTRAVVHLLRTGEKGPGGSTITMQVARNFFLGREKTYIRKLNEILLALKIERELGKDEILELYLNKIFLGHRAYGVGAAAKVYYGKELAELGLVEVAMIAGLPKAPSRFNPIVNPERALSRRDYVLGRMRELDFIDEATYREALDAPITAKVHGLAVETDAPYVAEMVRAFVEQRFGDEAYTNGYEVYTTIDDRRQKAANRALHQALINYDMRHGYRGPEDRIDAGAPGSPAEALRSIPRVGGLRPALVTAVDEKSVRAHTEDHGEIEIQWAGLSWARAHIDENRRGAAPKRAADMVAVGDIIRVRETTLGDLLGDNDKKKRKKEDLGSVVWALTQIPAIEGALVALDPKDGAMLALTGGFDFFRSKFNRVLQAERQPGSSFKPFIYSAALDKGFTAASFINDAPVVFEDPSLEAAWRPENYSGKFFGPTRLREALYKSRNLVSIRLMRGMGIDYAVAYLARFGLDPARLPANLSLSLGSGTLTPVELARGYAALANGGYLVEPYFIDRIELAGGDTIFTADPLVVCDTCNLPPPAPLDLTARVETPAPAEPEPAPRAPDGRRIAPRTLSAENVWIMNSMMRDVVQRGTARRARALGRNDLAGKTGTTNDQRDAWFSGFTASLVATAWVGFDKLRPLGRRETGGRAALPMWIDFMREALDGVPESVLEQPEGVVSVRINPATGELATADDPDAVFEVFRADNAPTLARNTASSGPGSTGSARRARTAAGVTKKLF